VQLKIIVEKGFYGKVRTIREREGGGRGFCDKR
jgi:hypothetical protein